MGGLIPTTLYFQIPDINKIIKHFEDEYFVKQPPRGVPRKRCSENMQQIYRRTPMPKCDFNKVAKQSKVIISEHLFLKTPLGGCFLKYVLLKRLSLFCLC